MRNLNENAAAVAELGIGADRAAMVEVEQDLQAHLDDLVVRLIVELRDEADAAGVVLLGRVVEALGGRQQRIAAQHLALDRRARRLGGEEGSARHVASILLCLVRRCGG